MTIEQSGRWHRDGNLLADDGLLRGGGCFSDYLKDDGQLLGVFVRSVHGHARIRSVSVERARVCSGVVAVLTAADIAAAGVGNISRPRPEKGRDGRSLVVPHRPALASDRVVHIGEPIALVVAETLAEALDAAEFVAVEYDALPAVTDAIDALAVDAPQIWREAPGNLALDWACPPNTESAGEVAAVIAQAPHVVRIRALNQRIAGVPLEARGGTAVFEAETGHFMLYAPSQSAHVLKAQLCAIMGVDPGRLRVLSGDVGGAFGLKTAAYPEYAALLVAAKKLGRPVHWMSSRSEAFLSDNQCRDQVSQAALALDGDGRFLALQVDATVNLGAYVTAAGMFKEAGDAEPAQLAMPPRFRPAIGGAVHIRQIERR